MFSIWEVYLQCVNDIYRTYEKKTNKPEVSQEKNAVTYIIVGGEHTSVYKSMYKFYAVDKQDQC